MQPQKDKKDFSALILIFLLGCVAVFVIWLLNESSEAWATRHKEWQGALLVKICYDSYIYKLKDGRFIAGDKDRWNNKLVEDPQTVCVK